MARIAFCTSIITLLLYSVRPENDTMAKDGRNVKSSFVSSASPPPVRSTGGPNADSVKNSVRWFGNALNSTQLFGCAWPTDFRSRYDYCYGKSFAENAQVDAKLRSAPELFGYGLLNWNVMELLLNCENGSSSQCDIKKKMNELEKQVTFWWSNIVGFVEFRKCLKLNIEKMALSCDDGSEVSQVTRGMTGLLLNLIDIVLEAYANLSPQTDRKNQSSTVDINSFCAIKTAETIHVTAAIYVRTQFYRRNSVFCWDEWTATTCRTECKKYASALGCLSAFCPTNRNFQQFIIWSWFFNETSRARNACLQEDDVSRCKASDRSIFEIKGASNISRSDKLFEMVKQKYYVFRSEVERAFHVPFYVFCVIMASILIIFIIAISLLCLWYSGSLGNKRLTVVRYAKLLDGGARNKNRLKVNVDETRSLTRDADDIEG